MYANILSTTYNNSKTPTHNAAKFGDLKLIKYLHEVVPVLFGRKSLDIYLMIGGVEEGAVAEAEGVATEVSGKPDPE